MRRSSFASAAAHATIVALLLVTGTTAAAQLPPKQTRDGITFLSGGIGADEEAEIRRAAPDFGLQLEFTEVERGSTHGKWTADIEVVVRAGNQPLLRAKSDGPLMLIKLRPGAYFIEAARGAARQVRRVEVKAGAVARERFVWATEASAR
jgi:hypothetical protein